MKIEIRNGKAHISGYVNAVGRDSRPIPTATGEFVEMIEPGAFGEALKRANNVDIMLNHDRKFGSTTEGNLKLKEDTIGLYAEAETDDAEVVRAAKENRLVGWSFGMYVEKQEMESREGKIPRRHVQQLDLEEVSIIDNRKLPCYAGTSVECRADKQVLTETRAVEDTAEISDHDGKPDEKRAEWEKRLNDIGVKSWQNKVDALKNSVK